MTSKAAVFALLSLWGVGSSACLPAYGEDTPATEASTDTDGDGVADLTNRVWVKAGGGEFPGAIKLFLSDGTLVQDSIWETHRMSPWEMTSGKSVVWREDGREVRADIVTLTADELVLSLKLKGGDVEERYAPSPFPYPWSNSSSS